MISIRYILMEIFDLEVPVKARGIARIDFLTKKRKNNKQKVSTMVEPSHNTTDTVPTT